MTEKQPVVELGFHIANRRGFLVIAPYHEGFIAEIKTVPPHDRRWFGDRKAWWFAEEHLDLIEYQIGRYFETFERVDPDTGEIDYVSRPGALARQERLL